MTERQHREGGEELDLATIARDDALLDALGRGEPPPAGDQVAAMLAAWRTDVDSDDEKRLIRAGAEAAAPLPAIGAAPVGRGALRVAAAVIALLAVATGLGLGSRNAGPSSPLWSLTRVLYPEQAQVRGVENTLAQARTAVAEGRLDEARALLAQARRDLAGVDDPAVAARLRAELDALERDLVAAVPALPRTPAGDPAPGSPAPTAPAPDPTGTAPAPPAPSGPPPAPSSSTPGSPHILPLPSLPLHPSGLPSLPLPSLPTLPLPTGLSVG
ncbi:anti-sigma-D factor RsdA [Micromonospora globbae]|uniref:anti-sigma-D factor RsdA n=1 Tax=Micromonospora globbae TaxID=1894969 RepID=UPI0034380D51